MSWSFSVVGNTNNPQALLQKIVAQSAPHPNYKRPDGDQRNVDAVINYLTTELEYRNNGVPTTLIEVTGSGHWDDTYGYGNYTFKINVFSDRRKTPYALAGE